jgi:hypothetical protein
MAPIYVGAVVYSPVAQLGMGVSMQEVVGKIGKSLAVSIFDENDYEFRL